MDKNRNGKTIKVHLRSAHLRTYCGTRSIAEPKTTAHRSRVTCVNCRSKMNNVKLTKRRRKITNYDYSQLQTPTNQQVRQAEIVGKKTAREFRERRAWQ